VRERGGWRGWGGAGGGVRERSDSGIGFVPQDSLRGLGKARCARLVGRGVRLAALGIQALEFFEGAVVVAAGGIDAALEAGELIAAAVEGPAQEALRVRFPDFRFLHVAFPELGFGLAEAAEEPFAVDEGIDQEALLRSGGLQRSWYSAVRVWSSAGSSPRTS